MKVTTKMQTFPSGTTLGLRSLAAGNFRASRSLCWPAQWVLLLLLFLTGIAYPPAASAQSGATLSALSSFDNSSFGGNPQGSLVVGTDGNFYGLTSQGGAFGDGTAFVATPAGAVTKLVDFKSSTTGANPQGSLVLGSDGNFYGMTLQGGASGFGTVFKMTVPVSGPATITTLVDFDYSNGAYPDRNSLVLGSDGSFYGMTTDGGIGYGIAFKMTLAGALTPLVEFDFSNGAFPQGNLVQGSNDVSGNLNFYGLAHDGGTGADPIGTAFRITVPLSAPPTITTLVEFDFSTTGAFPFGGLVLGSDGSFYGMASVGGTGGYGTVFKMTQAGALTKLVDFDGSNGADPQGNLVLSAAGNFYGLTVGGGTFGVGTAFKMTPGGVLTKLAEFDSSNGARPLGSLVEGNPGKFYGLANLGGTSSVGTYFELSDDAPPIANAGTDFSVNEGQMGVMLDGSLSSDPDNDALTYAWVQLPGGPAVTLTGANTASPTFTAPNVALGGETLTFQLTVTANSVSSIDTVSVTVVNVNHPPVAEAGPDQSIAEGSPVTLDGSASFDIDNDPFTYAWVQVGGTPTVTLTGADKANPTFTAPYVGTNGAPGVVATLVFELRVDDGFAPAATDAPAPGYALTNVVDRVTVEITNTNNDPVAAAGADQTVNENSPVALSAAASSDPDSDPLTYAWVQVGTPTVTLTGAATVSPSFTAPFVSAGGADLEFEVTVYDGYGGSATDTVVIHVQNISDPPLASAAQPTVSSLWPPNHQMVTVGITGVTDPNNNATITVTSVTQDEPTNGLGDGDTAIDAVINANGTVLLRAERSGKGDGRVYHIHFTATGTGGSAFGMVKVYVPHKKKTGTAIDGGELYDSTAGSP